jgi:copper homeostasis protein (lipoprotein)
MKNIIIAFAFIGIFSCKGTESSPPSTNGQDGREQNDAAHTSQNSLDWDGIYRGTLPCNDCEGIQTTVYINKDLTFTTKTKYIGKSDSVHDTNGKFSWNDSGTTITLTPAKGETFRYFVGEGTLTQLDKKGNKMAGENASRYILTKSNYAILEKYWKAYRTQWKTTSSRQYLHKRTTYYL